MSRFGAGGKLPNPTLNVGSGDAALKRKISLA
jgi:hypothetical protein